MYRYFMNRERKLVGEDFLLGVVHVSKHVALHHRHYACSQLFHVVEYVALIMLMLMDV